MGYKKKEDQKAYNRWYYKTKSKDASWKKKRAEKSLKYYYKKKMNKK